MQNDFEQRTDFSSLQGGSVVDEFLEEPTKYHVRGLTRSVESAKAKALAQKIEVVYADLKDSDSLSRAFQDAHIIYAMTDFWQDMSFDVEYAQGKTVVDIAEKLPRLEHFIWAALPDARAISKGKFTHIYHWQSKAAVTDYIRESKPGLWNKTTAILFPNYFENCLTEPGSYLPVKVRKSIYDSCPWRLNIANQKQQNDGTYARSFPLKAETCLPNVSIADTGKLVRHVVEADKKYASKVVAFYSEAISEGSKLEALGRREDYYKSLQYQR